MDELADLVNELAVQVMAHTDQLAQLLPPDPEKAKEVDADQLLAWVRALVDEYGLHAQIGTPERWETIPPLRAELVALRRADVRDIRLPQGSFELVYWHDALARVVERATQHADRWHQDLQNRSLLQTQRQSRLG